MEIFYVEKSEFLKQVKMADLEQVSDGRQYKSREKYLEHLCGLYLVKNLAKKIYNVKNSEIEIVG